MQRTLTSLAVFCFLFQSALLAQEEASPLKVQADSLREIGLLEQAIESQKELYASGDDSELYNMACNYALLGNRDSAFHYLTISTEQDTTVWPLTDPDLVTLFDDGRWQAFSDEVIRKVELAFGEYENEELARELWRMKQLDQAYYYHIFASEKAHPDEAYMRRALWNLKSRINDENLVRLEEIIAEHGWPKSSVVGGNAAAAAFLIVQHADLETQKKYIPLMREATDAGEARKSSLALLIDRIEMREGRPQVYGSQLRTNPETGQIEVYQILDPENVDARRAEMGLGPLNDYVARWGLSWPPEE